jgi:uncharacterized protein (DUF2345 family)
LPPDAGASISAAIQPNLSRFPASLQEHALGTAPTEGPWAQLAQPVATTDQYGFYFGISVAVSGNIMVVGDLYTSADSGVGEALVFVRPKKGGLNNWTQSAVLVPSDGLNTDLFASSVAISGNTIVVGSPPVSCNGCGPGRAYVFVEPAGGWSGRLTETAELTASDGITGAALGSSISISSDTVVVGAPAKMPGAAYVFVKPANGWVTMTQTAKLTASNGVASNQFGASVSISGGTIVVGAPYATELNAPVGAAYVFTKPASGWTNITQTATLTASDAASFDRLGQAVAISGDTVVAGAPYAMGRAANDGAAYIFVEPAGGWKNMTQTAKLAAPDGQQYDAFGSAVAISSSTVVSGAPQRSPGWLNSRGYPAWWKAGGAYVFTKSGSAWTQASVQVLNGSDAHNDDLLGSSVAVSGDLVITGAPNLGKYLGAAFVFVKP